MSEPAEFTVVEVVETKTKPKSDGTGNFRVHVLILSGPGVTEMETVDLLEFDAAKPVPEEGEVLTGTISENEWGKSLKPPRKSSGRGFGKSPEESKRITRQGAQQRAALYLIAKSLYHKEFGTEITSEEYEELIEWFVRDANK